MNQLYVGLNNKRLPCMPKTASHINGNANYKFFNTYL